MACNKRPPTAVIEQAAPQALTQPNLSPYLREVGDGALPDEWLRVDEVTRNVAREAVARALVEHLFLEGEGCVYGVWVVGKTEEGMCIGVNGCDI